MSPEQFRDYLTKRLEAETFQSVADSFGVSRQAVQQWANGATEPSGMALRLAEVLSGSS